jgi:hypothetical protein
MDRVAVLTSGVDLHHIVTRLAAPILLRKVWMPLGIGTSNASEYAHCSPILSAELDVWSNRMAKDVCLFCVAADSFSVTGNVFHVARD